MSSNWLNVKQVAERLGVTTRTVMNLIQRGDLEGFKVGREWRFTEADISEYEDRQRRKATVDETIRKLSKKSPTDGTQPPVHGRASLHRMLSPVASPVS
jgi:excisionase family DNA binding protein